jgi:hypothetical protein
MITTASFKSVEWLRNENDIQEARELVGTVEDVVKKRIFIV